MNPKDFRNSEAGKVIRAKTGYWTFVPARLPPAVNWTAPLINALSEAERELSKLATLSSGYPFPRILIQPFVRREAVLSSRIEGTRASLVDLYNYEASQLSFLEEGSVKIGEECPEIIGLRCPLFRAIRVQWDLLSFL